MHHMPYEVVKSQLVCTHLEFDEFRPFMSLQKSGNARPSFTATLIDRYLAGSKSDLSEQDERDIRGAASTLYSGGYPHTWVMGGSANITRRYNSWY